MTLLDLDRFTQTPLTALPFKHLVVENFIAPAVQQAVRADFPAIAHPGLLPLEALAPGPLFRTLVQELTGPRVAAAFGEKFGLDLEGRPTMVTVRGRAQEKDGRIHTDSLSKLLTVLIYFNEAWEAQGGRLRLLRSADNLQDYIAEVPPTLGTLVAFQRSDISFHGHEPFVGVRRAIMINWMASGLSAQRELMRHKLSAQAKKLFAHA